MPGEFFFLTFGGLGISLAGFVGLIFALDRRPDEANPITRWRIRNVAINGLFIAQAGLLVLPLYELTGSVEATVRIITIFALAVMVFSGVGEFRRSAAWPDESRRKGMIAFAALVAGLWLVNLVVASAGFLMLLFVGWIAGPIGTFANAILEIRVEDAPAEASKVTDTS